MLQDREKHTPETGYNIVGIDDFEEPGEQLYTKAHFKTWEEAVEGQRKLGGIIYPTVKRPNE